MSFVKSVPERLKLLECKHGVVGKNSPICYIPEQNPIHEALKKSSKTNHFKLTLPHTGSGFKVAQWASGTPEQLILHMHSVIHACKQMEHDVKFYKAKKAIANVMLNLEIAKEE
jgi:hypothetical protein